MPAIYQHRYRCCLYVVNSDGSKTWYTRTLVETDPHRAREALLAWKKSNKRLGCTLVVFEEVHPVAGPLHPLSSKEIQARAIKLVQKHRKEQGGEVYIFDENGQPLPMTQGDGGESVDTSKGKAKTVIVQDWQARFEGDSIEAQAHRQRVSDAAWAATSAACGGTPKEVKAYVAKPEPCQKAQLAKAPPYVAKPDPPSARYAYHAARRARK